MRTHAILTCDAYLLFGPLGFALDQRCGLDSQSHELLCTRSGQLSSEDDINIPYQVAPPFCTHSWQ
jgi:hypothetical protein